MCNALKDRPNEIKKYRILRLCLCLLLRTYTCRLGERLAMQYVDWVWSIWYIRCCFQTKQLNDPKSQLWSSPRTTFLHTTSRAPPFHDPTPSLQPHDRPPSPRPRGVPVDGKNGRFQTGADSSWTRVGGPRRRVWRRMYRSGWRRRKWRRNPCQDQRLSLSGCLRWGGCCGAT